MNLTRRSFLAAAAAITVTGLAACSSSSQGGSSTSSGGSGAAGAFPAKVKHAYGTTEIKERPERVATISWVNADTALALGVVPVAMPKIDFGGNKNGSTNWIDAKLKELGGEKPQTYSEADGVNFDAIAAARPDVILAAYSGLTTSEYQKLSKIAPVIGPITPNYLTSWQDAAKAIGTALGTDYKTLIADTKKLLTDAGKDIKEGTTFIAGNLDIPNNAISVYTGEDTRPRLFEMLGMDESPVIAKNAPKGKFFFDWSSERADELVSDVFYTWLPAGSTPKDVRKNKLFMQIPAVKADKILYTNSDHDTLSISAASALSLPWAVKNVIPDFIKTINE